MVLALARKALTSYSASSRARCASMCAVLAATLASSPS
jgi:hypothetical protein